ncbi:glycosyltransferase family 2 protein [Palleronia rufa]|uniref:glycosyltransferase family 2 protein n=1 Tax=Palleronia rufa TaxID=1530186 RepID=UPI0006892291|nr:glycosyltransferase [Palleronia rufa]
MTRPIAVVPARDEAARLPAALAALRRSGLAAIVVANGCTDATAEVARAHGATVIETPALPGGVGAARRIGLAAAMAARPDWLMTTDADCVLAPGAAEAVALGLARADAVFGRVEPDPDEFAALPEAVRVHGALEDRRDALRAALAARRASLPWNPAPCHDQSPGALIAWRPGAYAATGGIAPMPCHEDRRMAAALVATGARVARPWDAVVHASCRLTGRAPGGMADTIAARTAMDLRAETAALATEVRALARDLSNPNLRTGETHVPAPVQASV